MSTFLLAPAAPDPAVPATQLVNGVGAQVLDLAVNLAPVAVPYVLALAAISFVLRKFGLSASAGLKGGSGGSSFYDAVGYCECDDCADSPGAMGKVPAYRHHGACECRTCRDGRDY